MSLRPRRSRPVREKERKKNVIYISGSFFVIFISASSSESLETQKSPEKKRNRNHQPGLGGGPSRDLFRPLKIIILMLTINILNLIRLYDPHETLEAFGDYYPGMTTTPIVCVCVVLGRIAHATFIFFFENEFLK